MFAVRELLQDLFLTLDGSQVLELAAERGERSHLYNLGEQLPDLPWDLLLYVTAGQGHIRYRELAISTLFMTESDTGVLTYAGQAYAVFVTQCTLVIVEVCMTLNVVMNVSKCAMVGKALIITKDRQVCPQESLKSHGIRQPPIGM